MLDYDHPDNTNKKTDMKIIELESKLALAKEQLESAKAQITKVLEELNT